LLNTYYGHLVIIMVIWYTLWSFGTFCGYIFGLRYGHLVFFVLILYTLHMAI
jgi:hypothetical protein